MAQKMWGLRPFETSVTITSRHGKTSQKMKALRSSETSVTIASRHGRTSQKKQSLLSSETSVPVTIYQCTRHSLPEQRNLQQHCCKNTESRFMLWPFTTPAHTWLLCNPDSPVFTVLRVRRPWNQRLIPGTDKGFFSFIKPPDRQQTLTSPLLNGRQGGIISPGDAAGAWSWPFTVIWYRG